jgi:hypothetical protein
VSEIINQISIQDQILALALSSPERFPVAFRKYRSLRPEEVTQACLLHLGDRELDNAGRMMIMWLSLSADYLPALLDAKLLPLEAAKRVAAFFAKLIQQYLSKLVNLSERSNDLSVRRLISRA